MANKSTGHFVLSLILCLGKDTENSTAGWSTNMHAGPKCPINLMHTIVQIWTAILQNKSDISLALRPFTTV